MIALTQQEESVAGVAAGPQAWTLGPGGEMHSMAMRGADPMMMQQPHDPDVWGPPPEDR